MEKDVDLSLYELGNADAWSGLESDGFLKRAFLPVQQYSEITDPGKAFLCGRRGSGKSAIAIKLAEQTLWRYREAIQGEVSQYGQYMAIVRQLSEVQIGYSYADVKSAVQRLWEWVLPVKAMQTVVVQAKKLGEPTDPDLDEMERYLEQLPHPLNSGSTIGQLLSNTFTSAMKELPTGTFDTFLVNLTGTREFLSAVEALGRKAKTGDVLIALDTLESYNIFAPYMVDGFKGVLEAINSFLTDRRMRGVLLKFFVPAEIYEKVFSGIPSKAGGSTVFMHWRSADLISLLAGRFLAVLEKTECIPEHQLQMLVNTVSKAYSKHDGRHLRKEFWYGNGFLPSKILNTLGREEDCLAYMFRHTFRRPRDVAMTQMQEIVNNAALSGEFPYISSHNVVKGVHEELVLMRVLGDALSPYEGLLPGPVVSNARTVFYNRPWCMSGRDLRRFSRDLYSIHPFPDVGVEEFPPLLLRAGVVGLTTDLPSILYRKARFEYLMPNVLPFRDDLEYCVHPVMGDLFHMKQPEDGKAIYPLPELDSWLEEEATI